MPPTTFTLPPIPPGDFVFFDVYGVDGTPAGNPATISPVTATISNYTAAFVVKYGNHWAIVPKVTPAAGQITSLSVTFDAKDVNGNPLPTITVNATLQGPPAPPPAVALNMINQVVAGLPNPAPADPGSATVTG